MQLSEQTQFSDRDGSHGLPRGDIRPQQVGPPLIDREGSMWWWCVQSSACGQDLRHLREDAERVLGESRLQLPDASRLKSRQDISSDDVDALKQQLVAASLPPGTFFSGTHYINVNGAKSKDHPHLESLLDSKVELLNQRVAAQRATWREIASHSVF